MKKENKKANEILAKIALTVTKIQVNSACGFVMHQPKLPENAKKLRKF